MDAQFTSPKLKSICEQNGIVYLGLFGSYVGVKNIPTAILTYWLNTIDQWATNARQS
jgi:hypothetical protein